MDRTTVVLITLGVYVVALFALGVIAHRRTNSESDFLLGGRGLGAFVTAISASASSSSVWTLLGVSGYAYRFGLQSLWLFPACVGGFCINWCLVAPRVRRLSAEDGSLTVVDLLAGRHRGPDFGRVRTVAVLILALSLTVYVAQQFRGAGTSIEETFGLGRTTAILIGASVVMLYTVVGGLWAVSLTDTVQGTLMALAAIALPIVALLAVGGPTGLMTGVAEVDAAGFDSVFRGLDGTTAALGVLALLGIGLGYPGQPHVVNFFMASRDDDAIRRARAYALTWAVCVYAGMILVGLCGRVLHEAALAAGQEGIVPPTAQDSERAFLTLAGTLFPSAIAALMLAAIMSAIMSTADSQLLVVGSSVTHDLLAGDRDARARLRLSRIVVALVAAIAVGLALLGTDTLFASVLFAWTALGAAFGPLLLITLWRGRVGPTRSMVAMLIGSGLAVIAYSTPSTKGTAAERVLPFVAALLVLLVPSGRQPASIRASG